MTTVLAIWDHRWRVNYLYVYSLFAGSRCAYPDLPMFGSAQSSHHARCIGCPGIDHDAAFWGVSWIQLSDYKR